MNPVVKDLYQLILMPMFDARIEQKPEEWDLFYHTLSVGDTVAVIKLAPDLAYIVKAYIGKCHRAVPESGFGPIIMSRTPDTHLKVCVI